MDWQDFVTIAAAPALAAVGGLAWAAHVKVGNLREKLADCEARLSNFQIEVAKKYASVDYLKDVEQRLLQSLNKVETSVEKLANKLDRFLDRGGE